MIGHEMSKRWSHEAGAWHVFDIPGNTLGETDYAAVDDAVEVPRIDRELRPAPEASQPGFPGYPTWPHSSVT